MNDVLDELLRELGWSPRTLARRLNRDFGAGTVAETAPYHWRDSGGVPRPPLPALVAHLLSRELGRLITVGELWQGRAVDSPLVVPADAALRQPWTRAGTLSAIDDWVVAGLLDRRQFLAISGVSLTSIPGDYLAGGKAAREFARVATDSPLIEQIEQTIPLRQRLDDVSGGGGHLEYVGAQFRSVALLVRQGGQPRPIEFRLLSALAEIGQLAGWMAFDAGLHGPAQRYLFTALRAAHECGYKSMAAHIVADLAFQAATREQPSDAVALGESAAKIARRAPASVRASVQTRLAYGHAIAGDISAFEQAHKSAVDVLADSDRSEDPAWMYYLTPSHLDTQAGYALTHVGTLASESGDASVGRSMLREGEKLLRKGAYDRPLTAEAQRRALFEGAWLATAAAGRGNLEEACALGRTAVARTATVRSARSLDVLSRLAARLRRARRNEYVRDFLPSLEACLGRTSAS
ncbi:transcriptional regulator [Kribbella sp. NBC_01484]|uniref:carph-isopro domain-containing protein n=1 Tax=Kribbella sp. NBC_01484 TaxID=2903579 RepID=UPI002E36BA73|nr:transcriptional regulator [Kribbella sp. NBC_01484]